MSTLIVDRFEDTRRPIDGAIIDQKNILIVNLTKSSKQPLKVTLLVIDRNENYPASHTTPLIVVSTTKKWRESKEKLRTLKALEPLADLLCKLIGRWLHDTGITRVAQLGARFAAVSAQLPISPSPDFKEIL
jgi:hypothetical protein